jgi:hypothetical protein
MTIVTERSSFQEETVRPWIGYSKTQPIFKSFLKLRNVSKNSPTTFQCIDGRIDNATRTSGEGAPILSLNVLGIFITTEQIFYIWRLLTAEGSLVPKTISSNSIFTTVPQTPFIVDPDTSTISLVKDRQSNLSCAGYGLPQPTFQWIKVNFDFRR